jgi:DNA-binding MarR family transcriptional regulator
VDLVDRNCVVSSDRIDEAATGQYYVANTFRPGASMSREALSCLDKAQRLRRAIFPKSLFSDPAWDILLALYRMHLSQQRLSILQLGKVANVAPTTTLRWVNCLVDRNLANRTEDPLDSRRVFVSLSSYGASLMERFCTEFGELQRPAGDWRSEITTFSIGALGGE